MFIEVHVRKTGEAFLLNADAIETVGDYVIYSRQGGRSYDVRETLAELAALLDPRRMTSKPPLPQVRLAKRKAS